MVKALIDIDKHANQVLNIVKAKYNLKDKSQAINLMAEKFEEEILAREFKPSYQKKLDKIMKGKFHRYSSFEELKRDIERGD